MSALLFALLAAAGFVAGLCCGHLRGARIIPIAAWLIGLAVAAAAGAFAPNGEDNALGVFVFTGLPTILWVLLALLGVAVRRLARGRGTSWVR